jgi:hypothetical protein
LAGKDARPTDDHRQRCVADVTSHALNLTETPAFDRILAVEARRIRIVVVPVAGEHSMIGCLISPPRRSSYLSLRSVFVAPRRSTAPPPDRAASFPGLLLPFVALVVGV